MRILIAEDDIATRKMLEVQLRKWNHEPVVCSDGNQAWQILKLEDSPRLAILDWMMPVMDGLQVCREVRKLERRHYVYIILLTARDLTEDIIAGLEAGADDYVVKPFDPYELRVRIKGGERIVQLQSEVVAAKENLEEANRDLQKEIQDRKAAERDLQRARDELERRVDERTAELRLANEMLLQEIAERRRAQDALGRSQARYKELVENANSIILRVKPDGTITFFNEFARTFFGYSEEEILGKHVLGTIVPEVESTGRDLTALVLEVLKDPDAYTRVENENIRRNGERVWVAWTNKGVFGEDGSLSELLCVGNDITELKRAEDSIRGSLHEKEALLQEIHHRVKNNLQVISSLLALQGRRIDDEKVERVLLDSQSRVRSMALIHEQLYQSGNLSRIDFREYLENLASALFQSYGQTAGHISFSVVSDPVFLGVATAIPCGLIANELLSNCLKHAFNEGRSGSIRLILRRTGPSRYRFVVSDNGKGLPADLDYRASKSLGFSLVTRLAELQLHGRLEVRGNGGTQVQIDFEDREDAEGEERP